MNESRNKYLLKNTVIFTIGNLGSKLITFFLVPLYTNILSSVEYGIVDIIVALTNIIVPLLTLNISEAVMRFSLDKSAKKDEITRIGNCVLLGTFLLALFIFPIGSLSKTISEYRVYLYFYVVTSASSQLYLCDLRGKELLLQYSLGNIIYTMCVAILNIIFMLHMNLGISGYFLAYILAGAITTFYAFAVGKAYRAFSEVKINFKQFGAMVKYSIVLIPNSFMWWIINSSDRVILNGMIGPQANGIYAIAYKLPTLVSVLTAIFNQAWSYSAIREQESDDEEKYVNVVFKTVISFVMLIGIGLLTIIRPFLKIYVSAEYYEAWKYTPFLIIGSVYLTLATFMSTSYTVHKDSFGFLFSGMFGAIFNIIFNFLLIPRMGIYGAALSTCASYIVIFLFRLIHTKKYVRYNVYHKEFILGSLFLTATSIFMFVDGVIGRGIQLIILILAVLIYCKSWIPVVNVIIKKLGK